MDAEHQEGDGEDLDTKKGVWTPEEDAHLQRLINQYGTRNWSVIASGIQGRSGKSCRLRWHNQLDPSLRKEPFSDWEDALIVKAHLTYGNKWANIAKLLPGRTDNGVKNHWNATLKRKVQSNTLKNRFLRDNLDLDALLAMAPPGLQVANALQLMGSPLPAGHDGAGAHAGQSQAKRARLNDPAHNMAGMLPGLPELQLLSQLGLGGLGGLAGLGLPGLDGNMNWANSPLLQAGAGGFLGLGEGLAAQQQASQLLSLITGGVLGGAGAALLPTLSQLLQQQQPQQSQQAQQTQQALQALHSMTSMSSMAALMGEAGSSVDGLQHGALAAAVAAAAAAAAAQAQVPPVKQEAMLEQLVGLDSQLALGGPSPSASPHLQITQPTHPQLGLGVSLGQSQPSLQAHGLGQGLEAVAAGAPVLLTPLMATTDLKATLDMLQAQAQAQQAGGGTEVKAESPSNEAQQVAEGMEHLAKLNPSVKECLLELAKLCGNSEDPTTAATFTAAAALSGPPNTLTILPASIPPTAGKGSPEAVQPGQQGPLASLTQLPPPTAASPGSGPLLQGTFSSSSAQQQLTGEGGSLSNLAAQQMAHVLGGMGGEGLAAGRPKRSRSPEATHNRAALPGLQVQPLHLGPSPTSYDPSPQGLSPLQLLQGMALQQSQQVGQPQGHGNQFPVVGSGGLQGLHGVQPQQQGDAANFTLLSQAQGLTPAIPAQFVLSPEIQQLLSNMSGPT